MGGPINGRGVYKWEGAYKWEDLIIPSLRYFENLDRHLSTIICCRHQ